MTGCKEKLIQGSRYVVVPTLVIPYNKSHSLPLTPLQSGGNGSKGILDTLRYGTYIPHLRHMYMYFKVDNGGTGRDLLRPR